MFPVNSWKDWMPIFPWVCAVSAISYSVYVTFQCPKSKKGVVNHKIQKECDKIVHSFDIEDLGTKACFCRCWKSNKFPFCDGSHNKHNEETGDNVGPLVIKQKEV
uniref:CDGSH iron-sulfur domain-containing protein 1 n=1 Tax=Hadrurus spadix TaxID=141984 RepID=A0A1W7RAT7_9SCOR